MINFRLPWIYYLLRITAWEVANDQSRLRLIAFYTLTRSAILIIHIDKNVNQVSIGYVRSL